mmetsp:Transcript_29105/g.83552  ORF Transcript_29105/g.83552 Transcript_29105/m.83552 type:complete len:243 (+) Transcript_29105:452-1180(+)
MPSELVTGASAPALRCHAAAAKSPPWAASGGGGRPKQPGNGSAGSGVPDGCHNGSLAASKETLLAETRPGEAAADAHEPPSLLTCVQAPSSPPPADGATEKRGVMPCDIVPSARASPTACCARPRATSASPLPSLKAGPGAGRQLGANGSSCFCCSASAAAAAASAVAAAGREEATEETSCSATSVTAVFTRSSHVSSQEVSMSTNRFSMERSRCCMRAMSCNTQRLSAGRDSSFKCSMKSS